MEQKHRRKSIQARDLRNDATPAERALWPHLSARKLEGVRFNRQVCIGPYICDFAARSLGLIIEIDGDTHAGQESYDADRTRFLQSQGYDVIRFWNNDVLQNLEGVVQSITAEIERLNGHRMIEVRNVEMPSPSPSRSREGDKGAPP